MKSTMKVNGQTDSSTNDDRLSTGSYKGKGRKGTKETSYCSACSKPDHNTSKCKIKIFSVTSAIKNRSKGPVLIGLEEIVQGQVGVEVGRGR